MCVGVGVCVCVGGGGGDVIQPLTIIVMGLSTAGNNNNINGSESVHGLKKYSIHVTITSIM